MAHNTPKPLCCAEQGDDNGVRQRKKSLPEVNDLEAVASGDPAATSGSGPRAMTREEISVLSASRREAVRRQLEEQERYKANPVMYALVLNPSLKVIEWAVTKYTFDFISLLSSIQKISVIVQFVQYHT